MTAESTPPHDLPVAGHPAWRAYCAMFASKQTHYGFLESLDVKYRHGGIRTLAERARLETLLAAHDRCVKDFATAIKALAMTDIEARDSLVGLMTDIGGASNGTAH